MPESSPSPIDAPFAQNRRATWFTVVGRVKRGVTASEVQADLDRVQAQLGQEYPATDAALGVRVRPLKDVIVGGRGSLVSPPMPERRGSIGSRRRLFTGATALRFQLLFSSFGHAPSRWRWRKRSG